MVTESAHKINGLRKVRTMTVGAINNAALLDPSQTVAASSWQTRLQQALGPVAQLFGENAQQLMSDLQSGKTSLSALAQSKGISQTDLLNAIKQGLQQSSANGGPQLSDTQLTNLASTIANRVHGHHHRGGGMGAVSGATTSRAPGVVSDSDGDNDGSGGGAAGAAGVTSTTGGAASLQTDVERLMFDLQSMVQSSASSNASSSTASTNSTSVWSNTSSANLLNQLSQFDQTL